LRGEVGAQLFIGAVVAAFVEEVKILLGQEAGLRAGTHRKRGFRHRRNWGHLPLVVYRICFLSNLWGFLCALCDSRFSAVFEFETLLARSFAPLKSALLRMTPF
jgi:hypothetical protein